jgi:hypothetical protein
VQASSTIYSLFGLVVGLGIAEILRGFAEAWRTTRGVGKVREAIRIGWLVPLLGTLVIMDQTQFYITAYVMRDAIPFTYFSLLSVLAVVGTYYVCSTFVFPDDLLHWRDFDAYYLRIKRIVASGVLAVNVALLGFSTVLVLAGHSFDSPHQATLFDTLLALAFLPLIAALIFVRSKRADLVLLILLNLNLVAGAIAPLVEAA